MVSLLRVRQAGARCRFEPPQFGLQKTGWVGAPIQRDDMAVMPFDNLHFVRAKDILCARLDPNE